MLRQWGQASSRVARGTSGSFRVTEGNRASSRAEVGKSGFFSSCDRDLGVPMEFQLGSQASSCMEMWKSAFVSSCKSSFRLHVELT